MECLEFFIDLILPGIDSSSYRNEYHGYILGSKGGRCVGLAILPSSCADRLNISEPQPPETLGACPGLYRDSFACIGALEELRKATISLSCPSLWQSVCPSGWNNSAPTWRIFV